MDSAEAPEFTKTDASGRYQINGLMPGKYQVWAHEVPPVPDTQVDAGRVAFIGSTWHKKDPDVFLPGGDVVQFDLRVQKR